MSDFNVRGGIGIMGFLSPMNTQDTYAVIDPIYGIDGLRNVNDLNELLDIPFERRRPGMIVGVNGGENYFKLENVMWTGQITDWSEVDLSKVIHVDKEIPYGVIEGINQTFILNSTPIPNSEHLYLNGLLQEEGVNEDYVIVNDTIIFNDPPLIGMKIRCSYRTS